MKTLAEQGHLISAFVPVDLSAAANDGDWVSLKGYNHCTVVLFKAAGTAGDDPTLTMEQATAVAGTGAKALTFTDIWRASGSPISGSPTFTRITQAAAATFTDATSAENQEIWIVEFDADDLDAAGGFDCLRMRVADVGTNAQIGCGFYILSEPRYGGPAANAVNPTID